MGLTIYTKAIAKHKKVGKKQAEKEESEEGALTFLEPDISMDEVRFDNGELTLWIDASVYGDELVWLSVEVPLTTELVADIVSYYIKKLGRLKTVLEATKEENP